MGPAAQRAGANCSHRLEARHDQPPSGSSRVDQLLGGKARPRTHIGEVTFHSAWPNAYEVGRIRDGSAGGNVGGEDTLLARSRWARECAAQVPVSHALRAANTGRDSLGVRLIITNRSDC